MITVTGTVGSSGKYLVTGIPVDTQGDQQISGVAESVDDLNATSFQRNALHHANGVAAGRIDGVRLSCFTMKTKISTKGQVVLPNPIRRKLGLRAGDSLDAKVEGDRIVLTPGKARSQKGRHN